MARPNCAAERGREAFVMGALLLAAFFAGLDAVHHVPDQDSNRASGESDKGSGHGCSPRAALRLGQTLPAFPASKEQSDYKNGAHKASHRKQEQSMVGHLSRSSRTPSRRDSPATPSVPLVHQRFNGLSVISLSRKPNTRTSTAISLEDSPSISVTDFFSVTALAGAMVVDSAVEGSSTALLCSVSGIGRHSITVARS